MCVFVAFCICSAFFFGDNFLFKSLLIKNNIRNLIESEAKLPYQILIGLLRNNKTVQVEL